MGPVLGGAITDFASPGTAFWALVPLQLAGGIPSRFWPERLCVEPKRQPRQFDRKQRRHRMLVVLDLLDPPLHTFGERQVE
jgi:hypothetical protein